MRSEGVDHLGYLLGLAELELIDRERRLVERRIRDARFPAVKSLDTFDFTAMPTLNQPLVVELARCEFVVARDNIIVLGNSGTEKIHIALALGLAACQRGFSVIFATAAGLVHQLQEARYELHSRMAYGLRLKTWLTLMPKRPRQSTSRAQTSCRYLSLPWRQGRLRHAARISTSRATPHVPRHQL